MGVFRDLASAWANRKLERLQGTPNTRVDSGGSINNYEFHGQDIDRSELRDVKQIRESGGVISHLVHAKALMIFGTGIEWQTENDEIAEYLNDELDGLDNLLIDLGEDAIWYPYSAAEIVETQGGGFSHVEPVEPWTLLPQTNEFGEVIAWEQQISASNGFGTRDTTETFEPDEIASFILNKSSGRDKTGISEVLRAEEEITQFRENREAVNKAIEVAGFPHHIWKVGEEGGPAIDDNELRRVRNRVDNMEGDTQFVMGTAVEHELIQPGNFDFETIQEHDLREVALSLGLPLELANVGSDGLGSGMPADLRLTLFERQARASQKRLADQFVEQVARVILRDYSPFDPEELDGMRFGDPIDNREENSLSDIAPYMTTNEVREELDKPPEEDDEIGDSYRKPANIQAPEEEEPEDGGGIGGLFRDARGLAEVPENANPIDDPSECDGQVVKGPRGGTYCVPNGGEEPEQTGDTIDGLAEALPDEYSENNLDSISNAVEEAAQDGQSYTDIVSTVEASVEDMDANAKRKIRQQAYINRTQELEVGGENVSASPVIKTAVSRDKSELKESAEGLLDDSFVEEKTYGPDQHGSQSEFNAWREERDGSLLNDNTAGLWGAAIDRYGNENVPEDATSTPDTVGDPLPVDEDPDAEPATAIGDSIQTTREVLSDMFGESVPVARGVSGEFAEEIKQAKENGETVELDHRALESWSTFPDHAEEFATEDGEGIIITTEVPTDDVYGSSFTTPGLTEEENEIIVGNDGPQEYEPGDLHLPDDEGMAEVYDVAAERGT